MTEHTDPQHTRELDIQLSRVLARSRRVMILAVSLLSVLVLAGFVIFGIIIGSQRTALRSQGRELDAACSFFRDLAGVPVKPVPPIKRPSRLTVLLVTHSRIAYIGLGCTPQIPPPDPSLVFWARQYGIRVPLSGQSWRQAANTCT